MNAKNTTANNMSKVQLFLDSSALFAGIVSPDGGARVLLLLAENQRIHIVISEQVVIETERAIARKLPTALADVRQVIAKSVYRIVKNPSPQDVSARLDWLPDPTDVPILVAAMQTGVDFFVTHNRKHFLEDGQLPQRAGLRIGPPGDALTWLREAIFPAR
jgi:predicted nucleic acid-binding protein